MKYVFGPVPSRRLGRSLGVDPIPHKTCNWNCIYCQLGRSLPVKGTRLEYCPTDVILSDVEHALQGDSEIDWVTIVGSGEPTLHSKIGTIIRGIKNLTDLPVAVITNGSLLYLSDVRNALGPADVVMPSLDAGTPDLYKKINRPMLELTFERLVSGMADFCVEFSGEVWIETMLIEGVNDSDTDLMDLAGVLQKINPTAVHINLPIRPPAESWVKPAGESSISRAKAIFGEVATVVMPIIDGKFNLNSDETLTNAVMGIITRHPMRENELLQTLSEWGTDQIRITLSELKKSGQAQIVERLGVRFWSSSKAYYPNGSKNANEMN